MPACCACCLIWTPCHLPLASCREAEVIHARWAMLGVISLLLSDLSGSPFPPKEVSKLALGLTMAGGRHVAMITPFELSLCFSHANVGKASCISACIMT